MPGPAVMALASHVSDLIRPLIPDAYSSSCDLVSS